MKLFLDTANIDEIKRFASFGIVDGVTTNPSLIAKEGVDLKTRVLEICEVIDGAVSAEVIGQTAEEMVREGLEYATWHKNIYVKLPTTEEGLKALTQLAEKGIRVNMTLVFTAAQALLVAKAGAAFVSPFIGRLDDINQEGLALIEEIMQIYHNYGFDTEVLVASIRSPRQVTEVAKMGADICTVPADVLKKLIQHPLTDSGLKKFLEDYAQSKQ